MCTPDSHESSGGGWGNHRPSAPISLAITWHGIARTVLLELKQHLGKAVTLLLCSSSKNKVERGALAHERIGTPFNSLEFPTDIVLLAVLWRLRSKLSLRDLADTNLHSKPQL